MKKNILITGGAGFIGSHVAELCLQKGFQVVVLDDLSMGVRANVPTGAELVVGDILTADLNKLCEEFDVTDVCHLAAKVSIRNSIETFYSDAQVNFLGTLRVIQCALRQNLNSMVMASSMAVYADAETKKPIAESDATLPISPYGVAKLAAERDLLLLLNDSKCRPVALRYFNTYGPRQRLTPYVGVITIFSDALKNREPLTIFGDGTQERDFVSVYDISAATVAAIESSAARGIYNVGSGRGFSVNQLADLMLDVAGLPKSLKRFVPRHLSELTYSVANIEKAQRELNYAPRVSLRNYLSALASTHGESRDEIPAAINA